MCLVTKDKFPGITQSEKLVYKIIVPVDRNCWKAPVIGTIHEFAKVLNAGSYEIGQRSPFVSSCRAYYIGSGYFHAYTTLEEAKRIKKRFSNFSLKIVSARIPKGSLYYYSWNKNEICANKLIIDKDLFNYE